MKFSTRTLYGLKAVLVLAGRFGEGSLSVSQIAKKENISAAYLEQILNALKKQGFVKSVRGPQGGYVLAKNPAAIGLDVLFNALTHRGLLNLDSINKRSLQTDEISIANMIFWKTLKSSIKSGLAAMSLKDLIDEARRLKKSKSHIQYAFHI
ncbi:MAG: hypothetical protein AUJ71_03255 [Candidatus Omnitrophica bacterium CG1_02_49_16]|nr:MAG: hypothetical protein AUJ71_03255 [Candidatus Omnitrophica bacterium CG1_02_49_16]